MWNEKNVRCTVAALAKLITDNKPDIVVSFWNPYASIAARVCHKPLVSVLQADVHPRSKGFIWWKQPAGMLPDPVPVVNVILDEYALPRIHRTGDLFVGDLTMVLGTPETDPLPETAGCHYIGAVLWQKEHEKLPDWVCDLGNDRPVVWVYPGNPNYFPGSESPFDSGVILHACIEALRDMDVQVVLTTGHHPLPKNVLPLPANFRHASYVPGIAMAARSDLLIHHGGYGSSQTGLFAGTPAVIIPTYSERESNARRIAAAGAGEFVLPSTDNSGRKKKINAEELRFKIERVLSDPSYRENARRAGEKMRQYGGAPEAARLIECFISGIGGGTARNE
jgi:UDP:flavonoid glycosyltransferase YjiC (YdhE family)